VEPVKEKEKDQDGFSSIITSQIIEFICDEQGIHIDVIRQVFNSISFTKYLIIVS